jgi:hypothetical protein
MTRPKSIIGALVFCALAFCALGAANASASGLTAATCTEGSGGHTQYEDSHCLKEKTEGAFTTVEIAEGVETAVTSESDLAPILKGKIALTNTVVECQHSMSTSGTLTNRAGPPMFVEGKNIRVHYTECHAFLESNPAKTCTVKNEIENENAETITTTLLKSTTESNATEHFVKFETEKAGGEFAKFKLENGKGTCPAALTGVTVTVTGSARAVVPASPHSHLTFNATSGGALKANGAAATYEGTEHVTMEGTEKTIGLTTS